MGSILPTLSADPVERINIVTATTDGTDNMWGFVNGAAALNGAVAEAKNLSKEVVDGFKVF